MSKRNDRYVVLPALFVLVPVVPFLGLFTSAKLVRYLPLSTFGYLLALAIVIAVMAIPPMLVGRLLALPKVWRFVGLTLAICIPLYFILAIGKFAGD